jgi:hypothetical protein
MPYFGGGSGGSGSGSSDHRVLSGRSDANQHPATSVSVSPITLIGASATTVQAALATLAEKSGASEISPIAAVAIEAGKVVALRSDGSIEPADHNTPAHWSRLAGVMIEAVAAGETARVQVDGLMRDAGWSWEPGAPVFVGSAGNLTQTPPTTGFVQHIGFSVGSDTVLVQVEIPTESEGSGSDAGEDETFSDRVAQLDSLDYASVADALPVDEPSTADSGFAVEGGVAVRDGSTGLGELLALSFAAGEDGLPEMTSESGA